VSLETAAHANRVVQVMGKIDFDAVRYDDTQERLQFAIYDPEAESPEDAERLDVVYYGVVPGNFDQATSVVLKGRPDAGGTFVADQMLVKCPSKYQGEGGEYQEFDQHPEGAAASDI
jgi:cytochrome c-type biogenesis protein CcmE